MACLMLKDVLQIHREGSSDGRQLYLKQIYSNSKSPLVEVKPCSDIGRTIIQLDAPFSLASFSHVVESLSGFRLHTKSSCEASFFLHLMPDFTFNLYAGVQ